MTAPGGARDKQMAALNALGQIEVDVPEDRMTAPMPDLGWMIRKLRNDQTTGLAFSQQVADALAAVTAERDQARQMLADAWDEGVSFGWHSTELRTDENPYRKVGL